MDHAAAAAILAKHGLKPGHTGPLPPLGGANRARVRRALNFLHNNPTPKPAKKPRKRAKKAE